MRCCCCGRAFAVTTASSSAVCFSIILPLRARPERPPPVELFRTFPLVSHPSGLSPSDTVDWRRHGHSGAQIPASATGRADSARPSIPHEDVWRGRPLLNHDGLFLAAALPLRDGQIVFRQTFSTP
jgi:hypothetical protein